jgi:hypothetical protein
MQRIPIKCLQWYLYSVEEIKSNIPWWGILWFVALCPGFCCITSEFQEAFSIRCPARLFPTASSVSPTLCRGWIMILITIYMNVVADSGCCVKSLDADQIGWSRDVGRMADVQGVHGPLPRVMKFLKHLHCTVLCLELQICTGVVVGYRVCLR